jgi:hypothetical protein
VILVRVAQDEDIDPAVPGRNPGVELEDQAIGIGSAVDQHSPAPIAIDQDRVALADIENGDVDPTVRPRRDSDGSHEERQGKACQPASSQPAGAPAPNR